MTGLGDALADEKALEDVEDEDDGGEQARKMNQAVITNYKYSHSGEAEPLTTTRLDNHPHTQKPTERPETYPATRWENRYTALETHSDRPLPTQTCCTTANFMPTWCHRRS